MTLENAVRVRLDDADRRLVDDAAEAAGLTLSEFTRTVLRREAVVTLAAAGLQDGGGDSEDGEPDE